MCRTDAELYGALATTVIYLWLVALLTWALPVAKLPFQFALAAGCTAAAVVPVAVAIGIQLGNWVWRRYL
jgi:hypothetical protein